MSLNDPELTPGDFYPDYEPDDGEYGPTEDPDQEEPTVKRDCYICGGDGFVSEPVRDNRSTGTTTCCPGCDGEGRVEMESPGQRELRQQAEARAAAAKRGDDVSPGAPRRGGVVKISLGTIEVSDDERAAVAFYYGDSKPASRQRMRDYIIRNGRESIIDQMVAMDRDVEEAG